MAHEVTLITGDGVGPELAAAARRCVDATGVEIHWDVQEAGLDVMARCGTPLPEATMESVRRTRCALKSPITTPVGTGFRSLNVHMRQTFGLFACIRPCKHYPGVRTFFDDRPVDIVIVRENTEDLYAGIEFEAGLPVTGELFDYLNKISPQRRSNRAATKPASRSSRSASPAASGSCAAPSTTPAKTSRKKVTAVHKANIMKHSDGLFLATARKVAQEYPDIEFEDRIVDNMCMQLVQKPELYDVLVLPNFYGDIVSDLAAGLVGGLGVAPGATSARRRRLRGHPRQRPKYKGQNKVNPTALILSGMLMLRYLKETDAADRLEKAVAAVIAEGKDVTYDMKPDRNDPTAVGTREMADAICRKL